MNCTYFFYGKIEPRFNHQFCGRVCKLPSSHFMSFHHGPQLPKVHWEARQSRRKRIPMLRQWTWSSSLSRSLCLVFVRSGARFFFLVGNRCFNRWSWGVVCENSFFFQLLLGCSEVTTTLCRVIDMSNKPIKICLLLGSTRMGEVGYYVGHATLGWVTYWRVCFLISEWLPVESCGILCFVIVLRGQLQGTSSKTN